MALRDYNPGSNFISNNPHPRFDKITSQGYLFYYKIDPPSERMRTLWVKVAKNDVEVAHADFLHNQYNNEAYCQNIEVSAEHRRKGIGNAIYVFAERIMCIVLSNFWEGDSYQSEEAIALWNQPNRPFGPQIES